MNRVDDDRTANTAANNCTTLSIVSHGSLTCVHSEQEGRQDSFTGIKPLSHGPTVGNGSEVAVKLNRHSSHVHYQYLNHDVLLLYHLFLVVGHHSLAREHHIHMS